MTGWISGLTMIKMVLVVAALIILWAVYQSLRAWARRVLVKSMLECSIMISDHRYFEKKMKSLEVLFLGACEFRAGIDDRLMGDKVFNYSVPSAGYIEQYYFLRHYISRMPDLKLLVLSVGDNSFCSRTANGTTFPVIFHRFLDYEEILSVSPPEKKIELLKQRWLYSTNLGTLHYSRKHIKRVGRKLAKHYKRKFSLSAIKSYFMPRVSRSKGHAGKAGGQQSGEAGIGNKARVAGALKAKNAVPKAQTFPIKAVRSGGAQREPGLGTVRHGVERHFSRPVFDDRALIYFTKILDLCLERGVHVVALCMPRSKDFITIMEEEKYISEDEFLRAVVNNPEYSAKIRAHWHHLKDYTDRADLFDKEGVELNKEGKRVFSERVSEKVKRVLEEIRK